VGDDRGEVVDPRVDELPEREQHGAAPRQRRLAPLLERLGRHLDRVLYVGRLGEQHLGLLAPRGGGPDRAGTGGAARCGRAPRPVGGGLHEWLLTSISWPAGPPSGGEPPGEGPTPP